MSSATNVAYISNHGTYDAKQGEYRPYPRVPSTSQYCEHAVNAQIFKHNTRAPQAPLVP